MERCRNLCIVIFRKAVYVDEGLLIDQFQCLEQFLSENVKSSSWCNKSSVERWKDVFFDSRLFIGGVSEFLKVVQFFFAIPSHNAHVERVFSLISSQRSKERNRLNVETIRHIALIQHNFSNTPCKEFHDQISSNDQLLSAVSSSRKYKRFKEFFS